MYYLDLKLPGPEIEDLLMATHYQHMLNTARSLGLKDLTARCAVTLIKYPGILFNFSVYEYKYVYLEA